PEQRPQLVRHQPLYQIRHALLNERSRHKKRRLNGHLVLGLLVTHGDMMSACGGRDAVNGVVQRKS
ncbi:hypothetical protein, partial [Streptomyces albogriseolus]|uniref:hypothetical protein n=1 Tax=Streptomyces albogriseolus TaxID=1887 RepID=UPI0036C8AABF